MKGALPGANLVLQRLGASGPIPPEQVGAVITDHFEDLALCFKLGAQPAPEAFGQRWLAFEIHPQGDVGRVEWVERAFADAASDACLSDALHRLRFPAANERTIADVDLFVGPGAN